MSLLVQPTGPEKGADTDSPANVRAEETSPEMAAYFSNRPLMWRNLLLITMMSIGWGIVFTVINPLMQMRMNKLGLGEAMLGTLGAANSWAYSYLVMYFAWKSDHTVSRFGRRVPYLFLSAPFIIVSLFVFPFLDTLWLVAGVWILQSLFMDIKAATIPLLSIDCMPRRMLARAAIPGSIAMGILSFFALRYGMKLADLKEWAPYVIGGSILAATTVVGGLLVREPPVQNPTTEKFKPWSAIKVACEDRRRIVLMLSVSLFQAYLTTYGTWFWLFAQNTLGMSRTVAGQAVAWSALVSILLAVPTCWLVDRVSPYRLLPVFCGLLGLHLVLVFAIHDAFTVMVAACLMAALYPFYGAADMMIYRTADPKVVGSFTSANSCLRGLFLGGLNMGMGFLIQHTGHNYYVAFVAAYILQLLGLVALFSYRHLMRADATPCTPADSNVQVTAG